jgi:hypothetical protein
MAITGKCNQTLSLPGVSISTTIDRSASGGVPPQDAALPAAKTGTLTTRTDNTDGELDDDRHGSRHRGPATRSRSSGTDGIAYQATVGTVAGKVVPFTRRERRQPAGRRTRRHRWGNHGSWTWISTATSSRCSPPSSNRRGHVVFEDDWRQRVVRGRAGRQRAVPVHRRHHRRPPTRWPANRLTRFMSPTETRRHRPPSRWAESTTPNRKRR